jgi:hypothetical protein
MLHVWRKGVMHTDFGGETLGKETTWKTLAYMEDNIEMYLQEIGWEGKDFIHLTQDSDR